MKYFDKQIFLDTLKNTCMLIHFSGYEIHIYTYTPLNFT